MTGFVLVTKWNELVTYQVLSSCLFLCKITQDLGIIPQRGPFLIQTYCFMNSCEPKERKSDRERVSMFILILLEHPSVTNRSRDCRSKFTPCIFSTTQEKWHTQQMVLVLQIWSDHIASLSGKVASSLLYKMKS